MWKSGEKQADKFVWGGATMHNVDSDWGPRYDRLPHTVYTLTLITMLTKYIFSLSKHSYIVWKIMNDRLKIQFSCQSCVVSSRVTLISDLIRPTRRQVEWPPNLSYIWHLTMCKCVKLDLGYFCFGLHLWPLLTVPGRLGASSNENIPSKTVGG